MYAVRNLVIALFVPVVLAEGVTFKNVTFRGYSLFVEKFSKTISTSNSLRNHLPELAFDKIEFKGQHIPIVYKDSLVSLDGVDELVIEYCGVEEIEPGALGSSPDLYILSLKGNRIKELKEGVFDELSLSTLDLSNNLLTTIQSTAFDGLPLLITLNLANNQLSTWNRRWIKNNGLLVRVVVSNNTIESLPAEAFVKNRDANLTIGMTLDFSYNKISYLSPKAFEGLDEDDRVWLDNNLLQDFDEDLLKGKFLKEINISNNQISCLDGDLDMIFNAKVVRIDSNPMKCDCVEKIKKWSKESGRDIQIFYMEMECLTGRLKKKVKAIEDRLKEIKSM